MLRAIIVVFFIVVLAFAFVALQVVPRHGPRSTGPAGPAPLLETRDDGSVYAVSLEMEQLERRLIENEERSRKLSQDLAAAKKERDDLAGEVDDLQNQMAALRRQVNQRPAPTPQPAPAVNGPAPIPPNPSGATPTPPGTGGTQ
jgi:septal ring factor EnvC (AmiA/AmiB activator)